MRSRSRSRLKNNAERKFPVRVRVKCPETGYGLQYDDIYHWLQREVGPGNYVWTSDNQPGFDASAIFLRNLDDATRLVERFELELLYLKEQVLI